MNPGFPFFISAIILPDMIGVKTPVYIVVVVVRALRERGSQAGQRLRRPEMLRPLISAKSIHKNHKLALRLKQCDFYE